MQISALLVVASLGGCFTVDKTKTVELPKEELKQISLLPEDSLLKAKKECCADVWIPGREFYAFDNRAILAFDRRTLPSDPLSVVLEGKTLKFHKIVEWTNTVGDKEKVIEFRDSVRSYFYRTGCTASNEKKLPDAAELPMLVDMALVERTDSMLHGRTLWTTTTLWYDAAGTSLKGRKYWKVTVDSVTPGRRSFPLQVWFSPVPDANEIPSQATAFLTYGAAGADSRPFSSIFSLVDPKSRHPKIEKDVWKMIQKGMVEEGMTKEECRLALGDPSDVINGNTTGHFYDVWQYSDGTYLMFQDGVLIKLKK